MIFKNKYIFLTLLLSLGHISRATESPSISLQGPKRSYEQAFENYEETMDQRNIKTFQCHSRSVYTFMDTQEFTSSIGILSNLSNDVWKIIIKLYLSTDNYMVINKSFYTIATGYAADRILLKGYGLDKQPDYSDCLFGCESRGIYKEELVNSLAHNINQTYSSTWYSLVKEISHVTHNIMPLLAHTNIEIFKWYANQKDYEKLEKYDENDPLIIEFLNHPMEKLAKILPFTKICELCLNESDINETEIMTLGQALINTPTVEIIYLEYACDFDNETLYEFLDLLKDTNVRIIAHTYEKLNNIEVKNFLTHHIGTKLEVFDIQQCELDDVGLKEIEKIFTKTNIIQVDFTGNHLTDLGAHSFIKHVLNNTENKIEEINFIDNQLTEDGISFLKTLISSNPMLNIQF